MMSSHVRRLRCTVLLACAVLTWLSAVRPLAAEIPEPKVARGKSGMVVAVSEHAAAAGVRVLKSGGNAVDAAVAVALAMAVTHPEAGNIGGGGFMMVLPAPGEQPVCVEYRETAPAAAQAEMFALDESHFGHKIVGTPGTLRGLELAHRRYGQLPWKRLVMPAVLLAEEGFRIDQYLARSLNELLSDPASEEFAELRRVFGRPDGKPWAVGDRLVQPDLARTMRQIAEDGADAFYTGPLAELLVAEMKAGGGLITRRDLADYRAKVRAPIHGTYRGCDVYGPPPPSSGGICLVQMLNVLERFDLKEHRRWSPYTMHVMLETMRRAFVDRARYLGDADFVRIPPKLTSKEYAARLARSIDLKKATPSEELAGDIPLAAESTDTTHFSIIDADGMAVSNTYTLEHSYGSRVVVRGAGFLLNNEMGDFNWKAGHTDRDGRIGTPPNLIAPGKRMLSSQTPVLVTRDGRALLVTGSPGGRTIINTMLAVVVNVLEFEMDLPAAVRAPRLHHQWLPDAARFEGAGEARFEEMLAKLQAMGHRFQEEEETVQGDAHSIWIDPETGEYLGVADSRRSGSVGGY